MLVWLATCADFPDGEPGHELLDAALLSRGVEVEWVSWDDAGADWSVPDLVAVRATWDYVDRWEEFLTWARRVEETTPLLNGAEVFAWNVDKAYLVPAADDGRVPVLPTVVVTGPDDVERARSLFGDLVLKPRVGAGGVGVTVLGADEDAADLPDVPLIVQPLVESVRTEGELTIFVLDGRPTAQVRKRPPADSILVHEHLGGTYVVEPQDADAAAMATRALEVAADFTGRPLDYGRVDLLRWRDAWYVSELEVTEPALYLDLFDANADAFADLCLARLATV